MCTDRSARTLQMSKYIPINTMLQMPLKRVHHATTMKRPLYATVTHSFYILIQICALY